MTRWRAEYDDGIWRFYRDGIELHFSVDGDIVVDALNKAETRIAELEHDLTNKEIEYTDLWDDALAFQSRIAELESLVEQLIWVGNDLLVSNTNPVTITLFNGLVCNAKERER